MTLEESGYDMLKAIEKVMMDESQGAEPSRHDLAWLVARGGEVFVGIELAGRSLLELGSGTGLFCFYAASQGASSAMGLEPEAAGSTSGMYQQFTRFREATGADMVETLPLTFQDYQPGDRVFDVVLSYNSINHLNEEACRLLPGDPKARTTYLGIFRKIREVVKPGGVFIAWDVGRSNVWDRLGLKNPLEPTLDWTVHQNPNVWLDLLREAGFEDFSISWPTYHPLRSVAPLLNNRFCAFLTSSRFRLVAR